MSLIFLGRSNQQTLVAPLQSCYYDHPPLLVKCEACQHSKSLMVALVFNDERATRAVQIVTTPPPTTGEGGLQRRGSEGGGGAGPPSWQVPVSCLFIISLSSSLGTFESSSPSQKFSEECWTGTVLRSYKLEKPSFPPQATAIDGEPNPKCTRSGVRSTPLPPVFSRHKPLLPVRCPAVSRRSTLCPSGSTRWRSGRPLPSPRR